MLPRYPNTTAFVDALHALNIRVIYWITSMVDTDSPNYQYGYDNDFYIKYVAVVTPLTSSACLLIVWRSQ